MENKSSYAQLTDLMNEARKGKITIGEFREKAEELYGIKLPELKNTLTDMADVLYFKNKSDISLQEYSRRAEMILDAMIILDEEHVAEKFAPSGRLTI